MMAEFASGISYRMTPDPVLIFSLPIFFKSDSQSKIFSTPAREETQIFAKNFSLTVVDQINILFRHKSSVVPRA
jgi:hypothetical protein